MGFLMTTESQDLGLTSHPKVGLSHIVCRDIGRHFVHICGVSIHVFTCMLDPVTIRVSVCVIPQERKWQWGVSRPPGD